MDNIIICGSIWEIQQQHIEVGDFESMEIWKRSVICLKLTLNLLAPILHIVENFASLFCFTSELVTFIVTFLQGFFET